MASRYASAAARRSAFASAGNRLASAAIYAWSLAEIRPSAAPSQSPRALAQSARRSPDRCSSVHRFRYAQYGHRQFRIELRRVLEGPRRLIMIERVN